MSGARRTDESLAKRVRRVLKKIPHRARMLSAAERPLPDVVVIGTMRAGSTFLRRNLEQHPEILPAMKKEVHFFDYNHHRGERWYRAFFPRRREIGASERLLDSSPCYIFHPLAPQRLEAMLPEARLIALLRDPIERTLSHYFHEVRRGRESLDMLEALQVEEKRLAGEEERICSAERYPAEIHRRFSYKARSVYVDQLRRWEPWLRDGRLHLIQSEELYAEPVRVMTRLFEFLDLDPERWDARVVPQNVGHNRTRISPEVLEYLEDYFRPHNAALEAFLDRSFDWQRAPAA